MELVAPAGPVYQAGTFSGNPVSVVAGLKTLEILLMGRVHEKINRAGEMLRSSLREIVEDASLPVFVGGVGSMFQIFFSEGGKPVKNYADALKCDKDKYMRMHREMLNAGIFLAPSQFETNFISVAHTREDLKRTEEAFKEILPKIA